MKRLSKKIAQEILNISDNSHVGDIVRYHPDSEYDDTLFRLSRAGYIVLAGDRYVITRKALWV